MKKIIYIVLAALTFAAVSCQMNPEFEAPDAQDQGLTLRFTSVGLSTKAEVPGVSNENLIKQIDYFFFPVNAEGEVDDDTEYAYKGHFTPEDDGLAGSYDTTFETGVLSKIFPDGATEAMVFAVANYVDKYGDNNDIESPVTTLPENVKTWKDLHELEVGPTFFYDDQDPDFLLRWPHVLTPESEDLFFVMTGEKVVELKTGAYAVNEIIPLERLVSKVTVEFTYQNYTETKLNGEKIYWVPQPSGKETRVYLSNAIEHTTLGGPLSRTLVADSEATATKPLGDGTRDIFEYAYNYMNDITTTNPDTGNKVAHFYTYPIQMEQGDDNQPHLKLVLPWYGYKWRGSGDAPAQVDTTNTNWILYKQTEVYYKIALPDTTISQPNRIYQYAVTVNTIGSDKDVEITGYDYVVKDWLSGDEVSSNVATGRYISLDIPKDEYDMYVDDIEISFVSSGKVTAYIDSIYQFNYSAATTTKDEFMRDNAVVATQAIRTAKGITSGDILGWVTIPDGASYLKINHTMDNTMMNGNQKNTAFDMAPYVFVITLHLDDAGDDHSFDRTVTITQYPSLFVVDRHSDGYVFINGYDYSTNNNHMTYDNRANNNGQLGTIANNHGTLDGTGDNDNPNNYLISASIISSGSYVIGDPRSHTVDNLSNLNLTNYYPSSKTGSENIVAPKFIVSSSYSALASQSAPGKDAAERRCAAYQENGYPAGRWRLPTAAEILFMATLSKYDFIPSLFNFGNTLGYWTANGKIRGDGSGEPYLDTTSTTGAGVRCVYDAWYWGEEPVQENATTWMGFYDNK